MFGCLQQDVFRYLVDGKVQLFDAGNEKWDDTDDHCLCLNKEDANKLRNLLPGIFHLSCQKHTTELKL